MKHAPIVAMCLVFVIAAAALQAKDNKTGKGGKGEEHAPAKKASIWTGAIDSDWHNAGNWKRGVMPTGNRVEIRKSPNDPVAKIMTEHLRSLVVDAAASLTILGPSSLEIDGNVVVRGRLNVEKGVDILLHGGSEIRIKHDGSMRVTGEDSAEGAVSIAAPEGKTGWRLKLGRRATLDVETAHFIRGKLWVQPSVACEDEDKPDFSNVEDEDDDGDDEEEVQGNATLRLVDIEFSELRGKGRRPSFIDLRGVVAAQVSLQRLSFYRGDFLSPERAFNVRADERTGAVTVYEYGGDLGGESFDLDPADRISWSLIPPPLVIPFLVEHDGEVALVDALGELLVLLRGAREVCTVRSNYVDDAGNPVTGTFALSSTLVLPNFSCVFNIDGAVFATESATNGALLDVSAVFGGGSVNLYNCMLVDAQTQDGARAFVKRGSSVAPVNAVFCTIDSEESVAQLSSASNCIFVRPATPSYYVDYANRNLRLSLAGHRLDAAPIASATGSFVPGFERDLDGKLRDLGDITRNDAGAHYYGSGNGAPVIVVPGGVDGGQSTGGAVVLGGVPASNTPAGVNYLSAYNGTQCFLTAVNRVDATIAPTLAVNWPGVRSSFPTFLQATGATLTYWIYVPYDSDSDGLMDRIRKIQHVAGVGLSDFGDLGVGGLLASASGSNPDITNSSGWSGSFSISPPIVTGAPAGTFQFAVTTQTGGGQVHLFYVNPAATDGEFYGTATFALASRARASESYLSGATFNLNPNPAAPISVAGLAGTGALFITRVVDGLSAPQSAVYLRISRGAEGSETAIEAVSIAQTDLADGPAPGESYTLEPLALANAGQRRLAIHNASAQVSLVRSTDMTRVTLDVGLAGYQGAKDTNPFAVFFAGTSFLPFFNSATGFGAVVAAEYLPETNGNAAYELLTAAYSDARLRYSDTDGNGKVGDFVGGIARVSGSPTSMLLNVATKTLYVATATGYLYAYRVGGSLGSETAVDKGILLDAYPVRITTGSITHLSFMVVTNDAIETSLGLPTGVASNVVVGVFTDSGQIVLVAIS